MLNIALDFDGTFTARPLIFSNLVKAFQENGDMVYCVTSRKGCIENRQAINKEFELYGIEVPIIFCNFAPKVDDIERQGIKIDIWLDDAPYGLVRGY